MHARDAGRAHRLERALEGRLVLGREADDHVGGDVHVRDALAHVARSAAGSRPSRSCGPSPPARASSPDWSGTCRCGQIRGSSASASSSESLTWITSTDDSRTRSTPVDAGHLAHQVAELEPALGIAVVADRDAGHDHLGLSLLDAPARLVAAPRSAGRERAAPRTLGMMQYEQWQSQPSCTLTKPRVRPPRCRSSAAGRAACRCTPGPAAPATCSATSSAVPTSAVTGAPISSNCRGVQVRRAARSTITRRPSRAERRADWRDLASASRVMQHVLITCSSASCLGRLLVAGRQQPRAGEHRVGLRDLAAEELDRERRHQARHDGSPVAGDEAAALLRPQRASAAATSSASSRRMPGDDRDPRPAHRARAQPCATSSSRPRVRFAVTTSRDGRRLARAGRRAAASSSTRFSRALRAPPRSRRGRRRGPAPARSRASPRRSRARPEPRAEVETRPSSPPASPARSAAGSWRSRLEQQLEAHARGRMGAGAERAARVDHDLLDAAALRRLLPGRPHVQAPGDQHREVEALPALVPVVGHLLGDDLDQRVARRCLERPEVGQLAGRAVDGVFDDAVAAAGRVDLLDAARARARAARPARPRRPRRGSGPPGGSSRKTCRMRSNRPSCWSR